MSEPFLGQVILFAGNFAPRDWALCDGQVLPINQNQALFALLGTTYGGDGRTTFALPDLRGRAVLHEGAGHALGQRGGAVSVSLTAAELPAHEHTESSVAGGLQGHGSDDADSTAPGPGQVLGNLQAPLALHAFSDSEANTTAIGGTSLSAEVADAGSSQAHENRQPYLALNYIIALRGIFPSRG